ncbi:ribosomal protein L22/L17 [Polychytrium aggregatum]|uniref:ribosomal protein L22/L17 n=1 Tax=Polychytrium aggregatum TaxID=110093 RepID=UPI0022FDDC29|nr:ribosomal protein L22/L17 [Polychytrium aggregatum]KAI9204044.1 ribosomal protein L22/L17 [Polychytrium aggregatum]
MLFKLPQRLLFRPAAQPSACVSAWPSRLASPASRWFASSALNRTSLIDAALTEAQNTQKAEIIKGTSASSASAGFEKTFSTGHFRVSPQKLNHLARILNGISLQEGLKQMQMCLKKPSVRVEGLLRRAAASWEHNYGGNKDLLYIRRAWVGKGPYMKRIKIHGRGRFGIMHHPTAHLRILVTEKANVHKKPGHLEKLAYIFKKNKLWTPLSQRKAAAITRPPWYRHNWKYLTSPKWVSPDNALLNTRG